MNTSAIQKRIRRVVTGALLLYTSPVVLLFVLVSDPFDGLLPLLLCILIAIVGGACLKLRRGNSFLIFLLASMGIIFVTHFGAITLGAGWRILFHQNVQTMHHLELALMRATTSAVGFGITTFLLGVIPYIHAWEQHRRPSMSSVASIIKVTAILVVLVCSLPFFGLLVMAVYIRAGEAFLFVALSAVPIILGIFAIAITQRHSQKFEKLRKRFCKGEIEFESWKLHIPEEYESLPSELPRLTPTDAHPNAVVLKRTSSTNLGDAYRSGDRYDPWALVKIYEEILEREDIVEDGDRH